MAATGIGNPVGAEVLFDGGVPRILSGKARTNISGGVLVFSSGATGVVSSGADSFVTSDLTFAIDASGAQFTGIALQDTGSNQYVSVARRGDFLLTCNGNINAGTLVACDGSNAVLACGSEEATKVIGRAVSSGASGGYALVSLLGG